VHSRFGDDFWLEVFSDSSWARRAAVETKTEFDDLHRVAVSVGIVPGLLMWYGRAYAERLPVNVGATVLRSVFDRPCEVAHTPVRGSVIFTGTRPLTPDAAPHPLTEENFARLSIFMNLVRHETNNPRTV
jgi:pimeloyl-ACP methyl ester carboxylesterase